MLRAGHDPVPSTAAAETAAGSSRSAPLRASGSRLLARVESGSRHVDAPKDRERDREQHDVRGDGPRAARALEGERIAASRAPLEPDEPHPGQHRVAEAQVLRDRLRQPLVAAADVVPLVGGTEDGQVSARLIRQQVDQVERALVLSSAPYSVTQATTSSVPIREPWPPRTRNSIHSWTLDESSARPARVDLAYVVGYPAAAASRWIAR